MLQSPARNTRGNEEITVDINLATLIVFLVSLFVSALIIYLVTTLFGEKEGFGTALLAAFIGAILYSITFFFLRPELGWVASLVGGIAWLLALVFLYDIGVLKALGIAILIWIITIFVGFVLPVTGPY